MVWGREGEGGGEGERERERERENKGGRDFTRDEGYQIETCYIPQPRTSFTAASPLTLSKVFERRKEEMPVPEPKLITLPVFPSYLFTMSVTSFTSGWA